MRDHDELFRALSRSPFRRRFVLGGRERAYAADRGVDVLMEHAARFVEQRLAPAAPANDGRQTPMRRHPVFVAQHATATCCRGCLARWHGIPARRALTGGEKAHVLAVIRRWLEAQVPQQ
ncbi:MAG TPA: DUF4186 domain-containing protein [Gammaproteobacteria bacterium]|nr:DUF4186 domain-containing protein [Gammaproteobacteria bacterium]